MVEDQDASLFEDPRSVAWAPAHPVPLAVTPVPGRMAGSIELRRNLGPAGMALMDAYAIACIQGILAQDDLSNVVNHEDIAVFAWKMAKAMLKHRPKPPPQPTEGTTTHRKRIVTP